MVLGLRRKVKIFRFQLHRRQSFVDKKFNLILIFVRKEEVNCVDWWKHTIDVKLACGVILLHRNGFEVIDAQV